MDATLTDPADEAPFGRGGDLLSLRPPPGRWDAMLARSAAAFDLALRATLSADRGTAPLTRWQRTGAAGAALAGAGGVGALAALAALKPDLGAYEPAALLATVAAAALPVALCIRRAVVTSERSSAPPAAHPHEAVPGRQPGGQPGLVRRLAGRLRARRRRHTVERTLADIALRERRLAERIAAAEEPRREERVPAPAPAPVPARQRAGEGEEPWSLPRGVADALADLEARERLHAGRIAAARRASPRPQTAGPRPAPASPAAPPRSRRHARIKPRQTRTLIATEDGRKLNAVIADVSQSGVAIEGNLPGLWIGSMVTVGSRRAKAVRVLPRGMAFEFSTPVPAEALTEDFVL